MRLDTTALPPHVRAAIYWCYGLAGVVLGSCDVGLRAVGEGQPRWLVIALAVYAYLGLAVGLVAATNTPIPPPLADAYIPERAIEPGTVVDGEHGPEMIAPPTL